MIAIVIVESRDKVPAVGDAVWVSTWSGQVHPWQGWYFRDGKCVGVGGFCKSRTAAVASASRAAKKAGA